LENAIDLSKEINYNKINVIHQMMVGKFGLLSTMKEMLLLIVF